MSLSLGRFMHTHFHKWQHMSVLTQRVFPVKVTRENTTKTISRGHWRKTLYVIVIQDKNRAEERVPWYTRDIEHSKLDGFMLGSYRS